MSDIEPFAEKLWVAAHSLCPGGYRIGYRLSATQAILAHVDIPAPTIERAVFDKFLIVPRITSDGTVTADVTAKSNLESDPLIEVAATPIDQLVLRGTAAESLRVEGARAAELQELLDHLERSASAVRAALVASVATT
jgi:hypothetical protein